MLTPAISNPKARPNSPRFPGFRLVSAGIHKLPGLSFFDKPSMNMTTTRNTVERMPIIDAYESKDRGIRTVGIMLRTQESVPANEVEV